jgi:predicted RNase H-like HicB family nuclease
MKYKVVLYPSEEGISICVPALPGCWSEGDTEEEALNNIKDAIQEYLAAQDDRLREMEEQVESMKVREIEMQV